MASPEKHHGASTDPDRPKIHRRELIGVVTSDKMDKTRVVQVERRLAHGKYGKYMTSRTKYKAHDEKNEFKVGDIVWIEEHRPISKLKRWAVVRGEKKQASP